MERRGPGGPGGPGGRGGGGRGGRGGEGGGGRGGRGGGEGGGRGGDGGGRGGGRGGDRGGRGRDRDGDREERMEKLIENVVRINRSAAVVKGGRRFSFSALVVVGDGKGRVGIGYGKANGVPNAVEKGVKEAKKRMFRIPLVDGSIPHSIQARFRASKVILEPASPGTGVIAGASVRAVLEAAGIRNILTKCHGSGNPINVVKAVEAGLKSMRTRKDVESLRGVKLDADAGSWKIKSHKNPGRKQRRRLREARAAKQANPS
ncbi:MAG: 30S ribosomal protein S5 [Planctomycetota bacterium]